MHICRVYLTLIPAEIGKQNDNERYNFTRKLYEQQGKRRHLTPRIKKVIVSPAVLASVVNERTHARLGFHLYRYMEPKLLNWEAVYITGRRQSRVRRIKAQCNRYKGMKVSLLPYEFCRTKQFQALHVGLYRKCH